MRSSKNGITIEDKITADSPEPKSVANYKSYGLWCRGAIKGPGSVEFESSISGDARAKFFQEDHSEVLKKFRKRRNMQLLLVA